MRQKKTEKKKQQSSKTAGYSAKQSKPRTLERKHSEKLKKTHLPVHTQLKDEWSAPWKLESAHADHPLQKKKLNKKRPAPSKLESAHADHPRDTRDPNTEGKLGGAPSPLSPAE